MNLTATRQVKNIDLRKENAKYIASRESHSEQPLQSNYGQPFAADLYQYGMKSA